MAHKSTEDLIRKNESYDQYYDVLNELGRGRFAVVKKCVCKATGKTYAAKVIKKSRTNSHGRSGREQLLLEIDILNQSTHPKMVRLFDVFETRSEMQLILELAAGGDLHRHCIEGDVSRTEKEICYLIRQIVEAVRYLHDETIVHLDLKPDNILLAKADEVFPEIRLIDFGLSRRLDGPYSQFDIVGTPEYVAPEVLSFEPIDFGSDMWSVGVVTYVLLSGISPFAGDDVMETYSNIGMVDYDFDCEEFDDISDEAIDFIEKLLVRQPKKRMTAREALEHPWLKQLEGGLSAEDVLQAQRVQMESPPDNVEVCPLVEEDYLSSSGSETPLEKSAEYLNGSTGKDTSSCETTEEKQSSLSNVDSSKDSDKISEENTVVVDDSEATKNQADDVKPTSVDASPAHVEVDVNPAEQKTENLSSECVVKTTDDDVMEEHSKPQDIAEKIDEKDTEIDKKADTTDVKTLDPVVSDVKEKASPDVVVNDDVSKEIERQPEPSQELDLAVDLQPANNDVDVGNSSIAVSNNEDITLKSSEDKDDSNSKHCEEDSSASETKRVLSEENSSGSETKHVLSEENSSGSETKHVLSEEDSSASETKHVLSKEDSSVSETKHVLKSFSHDGTINRSPKAVRSVVVSDGTPKVDRSDVASDRSPRTDRSVKKSVSTNSTLVKITALEKRKQAFELATKADAMKGTKPLQRFDRGSKSSSSSSSQPGTPNSESPSKHFSRTPRSGSNKSSTNNSPIFTRKSDGKVGDSVAPKNTIDLKPADVNLKKRLDDADNSGLKSPSSGNSRPASRSGTPVNDSPKISRSSIRGKIPGGIAAKMADKFSHVEDSQNKKNNKAFLPKRSSSDKMHLKDSGEKENHKVEPAVVSSSESPAAESKNVPDKTVSTTPSNIKVNMTLGGSVSVTGKKLNVGPLVSSAEKDNRKEVSETGGSRVKAQIGNGGSVKLKLGVGRPNKQKLEEKPSNNDDQENAEIPTKRAPALKELRGKSTSISRRRADSSPNSPRKNYRRLYVTKVRNSKLYDPDFNIMNSEAAQIMQRVDNDVLQVELRLKSTDLKLLP